MRFHTQTAGVSLTAQQPLNNIVRTAIEALAGVLGGTQSLHTNSLRRGARAADGDRRPHRPAHAADHRPRDGRHRHIDPLGGSYAVEAMTDEIERQCYEYFRKIDELGGMVNAVKEGFPQREIAESAYELQLRQDRGERVAVGVNEFTEGEEGELETLRIDPALERKQIDRLQGVKRPARVGRRRGRPHGDPAGRRGRRQHPAGVHHCR